MTISYVGTMTSLGGNDVGSLSWSYTSTPGAAVIVAVGGESLAGDITSVAYGGTALVQIAKKLSSQMGFVYFLHRSLVPAGANNIVVTFGGGTAKAIGFGLSYHGVGGYRTQSSGGTGTSGTATAAAMTTVPGDMCIFVNGDRADGVDHAAGGGATERGDGDGGFARGFVEELTATGTSLSMSCSFAGSEPWACTAVPLFPSEPGNQIIWIAFRRWQNFLRDLKAGMIPPDMLQKRYRETVTI